MDIGKGGKFLYGFFFFLRSSYSSKDDETGPQDFQTSSNWDLNFNMMQNISLESL
jgi:hypothetical protein